MSAMTIHLFGPPRLDQDGQPHPLRRSRALALLAYLCLAPGATTRDALLALLWPTFGPDEARNNLRRELSLLKATLPAGALAIDRQSIAWRAQTASDGLLQVDVLMFEAAIAQAAGHAHEGELCPSCAAALIAATDLYQQDFLAGFSLPDSPAFDEWHFFEAERLRGLAGHTVTRLVEWFEAAGDRESAIDYARRRLAIESTHEPTHRALMRLYEASGQHAAAVRQYDILARLLDDELGVAPEAKTETLLATIQQRRLSPTAPVERAAPIAPPASRLPNNLPADMMPFIGRANELQILDAALADPAVRLISITGPGGVGKTRLAMAAATRQLAHSANSSVAFADGIYFVPLAAVDSSPQAILSIARALDLSLHDPENPARELGNLLRARRLLLLIDNVEHLLSKGLTNLLTDLLAIAPQLRLLVTSRVQLQARGEYVIALSGLSVPDPAVLGTTRPPEMGDAIALFITVARHARTDFTAGETELLAAAHICRLVQGVPLAIELAAGWLAVLGIREIVAELEGDLDFLETHWSDVPSRQASLRAVFDTSWSLLTAEEQSALTALSVFRGGFDRDAARAVAGVSLRTIAALVAKSWLRLIGPDRVQMHELLRQYAARELGTAISDIDPHQRHAAYYVQLVESQLSRMRSPRPAPAYDALDRETDNIQSALAWLVEHDDVETVVERMAPALFRFLESRFHYFRYYPLRELALRQARTAQLTRAEAILLIWDSAFFFNGYPTRFFDHDWVDEIPVIGARVAWEALIPQPGSEGLWDIVVAWEYGHFIDPAAGANRLRQLVATIDRHRSWEWAFALQSLGRLLARTPAVAAKPNEAQEALNRARSVFDELGDKREAAVSMLFLAYERQAVKDWAAARALMIEAQSELQVIGDDIIALCINWPLADMHMQLGETDRALYTFIQLADALIQNGHAQLAIDGLSRAAYDAVRYWDIEEARQLRQRSLAMSRAYGYVSYKSWDCWEMGEVYRVMGDAAEARRWYDRAFALFEDSNHVGHCFYQRGLGDLALACGDYPEATRRFQLCRQEAEGTNHDWQLVYALGGLARAALLAGNRNLARVHLFQALQTALAKDKLGGLATSVLRGLVEYWLPKDRSAADRLGALILAHPLTWRETRRDVARLLSIAYDENDQPERPMFDLRPVISALLAQLENEESLANSAGKSPF